jgi:hypothetical protein
MDIYWAGWRTTTFDLQKAGWMLSAQQDVYEKRLRLAMRHPVIGFSGMTHGIDDVDFFMRSNRYGAPPLRDQARLASSYTVDERYAEIMSAQFMPIDATPRFTSSQPKALEDLVIFKTIPRDARELYLSEASMSQVMDMAISLQEDKQREIRQRKLVDQRLKEMRADSDIKAELRLVV